MTMTSNSFRSTSGGGATTRGGEMPTRTITIIAVAAALLVGCASTVEQPTPLQRATDSIVEQSEAYLRHQAELRERLQKLSPPPAPAPVVPAFDPLSDVDVTLNVDNADIQFVLQALTEQAGVNLLIHPTLVESPHKISVHFTQVPASTVLKQVMRLADLHGKVQDNVLVVKPLEDRVFHLDFLEMQQTTRFSAGGDVLGFSNLNSGLGTGTGSGVGNAGGAGGSALTGEFRVDGTSPREVNPYDELQQMLDILVGPAQAGQAFHGVGGAASLAEVGHLSQISTAIQSDTPLYSLNRMTGTLYVQAKPSVMETVAKLVQRYKEVLGRQIMLEAQILEIGLDDEFQYGIDWTELHRKASYAFGPTGQELGGVSSAFPLSNSEQAGRSLTIPGQVLEAAGRSFGSLAFVGTEFAATVSLLEGFGTVRVLSNPTIRSKHGQASLISVGTSNSFVVQSGTTAITGVGATISQNIQTSTVFDGLVLGVIPFISDNGVVTLSVHPIQSNVDPASLALIGVGDGAISLPRVALKEISTLLKMNDGDVVVLGGLIDQTGSDATEQVPVAGDVPVLGNLFKKKEQRQRVRELVVVLKVTVV